MCGHPPTFLVSESMDGYPEDAAEANYRALLDMFDPEELSKLDLDEPSTDGEEAASKPEGPEITDQQVKGREHPLMLHDQSTELGVAVCRND